MIRRAAIPATGFQTLLLLARLGHIRKRSNRRPFFFGKFPITVPNDSADVHKLPATTRTHGTFVRLARPVQNADRRREIRPIRPDGLTNSPDAGEPV